MNGTDLRMVRFEHIRTVLIAGSAHACQYRTHIQWLYLQRTPHLIVGVFPLSRSPPSSAPELLE